MLWHFFDEASCTAASAISIPVVQTSINLCRLWMAAEYRWNDPNLPMNLKYQLLVYQNEQKRREKIYMDKLSNKRTNRGGFWDLRREIGHPLKEVAVGEGILEGR